MNRPGAVSSRVRAAVIAEIPLAITLANAVLFGVFGSGWLTDLTRTAWGAFLTAWLFVAVLLAAFSVVRHADALAVHLGEPLGTLVLTLSVISIEVMMISAAGMVVATLVLSPEALGAVRAALANRLQRAVNIALRSVAATIGLTIPAVLAISLITHESVVLGLNPPEAILLLLTLVVSVVTFSSGRTNVLQGAVHIVLFFTYLILIFD